MPHSRERLSMAAFATPWSASIHPQQQNSTNAPPRHSPRRPSLTPLAANVAGSSLDEVPRFSSQLVQLRLRLHLFQRSHHQRRRQSEFSNSTTLRAADELPLTPFSPPSDSDDSSVSKSQTAKSNHSRTHRSPSTPSSIPTKSKSRAIASSSQNNNNNKNQLKESYSADERKSRSERLRALWRDPQWRASMIAKRRSSESVSRKSESFKRLWRDEGYRERMHKARLGRPSPNKGVTLSAATRFRISMARKGIPVSEETKRRMSLAKKNRPDGDTWPKLISESKKGKTREYFAMKREFRALHRDLKLWSNSFKTKYGRLPEANTFERFVAPMMVLRIRRYLTLRDTVGPDEKDIQNDIFS